jgi:YVTN family beta-propeller protein
LVSSYPESGTNRFNIIAFFGEPVLYVALRNENAIAVIDTGPSVEVARIPVGNTPLSVVLTSDGHHLFVANSGANDGTTGEGVWAIDTRTHRVVSKIETGAGPLDMDLSADGRSLYVTNSKEGSVSILSTLNRVVLRTLPDITFGAGPYGIVDTPDGRLWVTDLNANALLQVDSQTGSVLATTQVVASPRSLAVSPSGDRIYVAGFQGDISVVSPSSGDVILTYDTGTVDRIFRVVVSPSGDRVYASDTENARLLVFETDRLAHSIAASPGSENARDIGVSSDGKWVFLSNQDSDEIVTIEAASGTVASILNVPGGPRGIAVRSAPLGISFDVNVATQSDFDGNGEVAFTDFLLFAGAFGASSTDAVYDQRFDLDADFQVGFSDFLIFAAVFGRL